MAKHDIPRINNIHPGEFHLARGITRSPWYLRQVVYTTAGIIGLAVTALGIATPGQVDDWFQTAAGIAAAISGALAAVSTGEHSDYRPTGRPKDAETQPGDNNTLHAPQTPPSPPITYAPHSQNQANQPEQTHRPDQPNQNTQTNQPNDTYQPPRPTITPQGGTPGHPTPAPEH